MQNYLAAVTPYLTKDNALRSGLIGVGLGLLIIAGLNMPKHHARSWFGSEPVVEHVTKPVKVVKPAQVVKAKPAKRVKRKAVAKPVVPPPAPEQPHGWTRECGINNWCNWVYYP